MGSSASKSPSKGSQTAQKPSNQSKNHNTVQTKTTSTQNGTTVSNSVHATKSTQNGTTDSKSMSTTNNNQTEHHSVTPAVKSPDLAPPTVAMASRRRRASIDVNAMKNVRPDPSKHQHGARPRTSRQRAAGVIREKTMALAREKTMGLSREKTLGLTREKTMAGITREKTMGMGLTREKTSIAKTRKKMHNVGKKITRASILIGSFNIDAVYLGHMTLDCPSTAKIVRIFTSSTFTDTMHERNYWMINAYPKIQRFCQKLGYEFQVVDMRWGVREEAKDDHTATELCLWELQQCQRLSTGPNFVSLLSHKYGYRSLLRVMDAAEFQKLVDVTEEEDSKLLRKWYKQDDNAVPPVYVLSPISKLLPDFLSTDKEKMKVAKDAFWEENDAMYEALEKAAEKVLSVEEARKHVISVTEREVQMGLLEATDPKLHCLWCKREIRDIDKVESSWQLSRYIECLPPEDKWKKARSLLSDIRNNRIPKVLPPGNVLSYDVGWTEKGVNPEVSEHKEYLEKMTSDFVEKMTSMIETAVDQRKASQKDDPLYIECVQHIRFCQSKCENFYGREDTLKKIEQYIKGNSQSILVIHGMSGSGKTSIVAMVAKQAHSWIQQQNAVVLRFVGTTPDSSYISAFLMSVTKQIKLIYGQDTTVKEELRELAEDFEHSLSYATAKHPLVLIIDSLDQFDPSNNARQLFWLPSTLPPYVKIVVSTLEEDEFECFPRLRGFVSEDTMIAVPKLPANDAKEIVNHWLQTKGRSLTNDQMKLLLNSFNGCPVPLYLKLSFDVASRWSSFDVKATTVLQSTIRDSINSLFSRLETSHGELLVSRALGYLTSARSGLSEKELEDILSCDDDVLNDVYVYWTPPIRRLPPLLLVRMRTDLQQYLVERGADNIRVMFWYHRQFVEAATTRYCKKDILPLLHVQLSEFFAGKWADGNKKSYKDKDGKALSEDRFCTPQPIKFGDKYNVRKMNNLPYHRILSGDLQTLKDECLCNFEFIQTKLLATTVRDVIDDFEFARKHYPNDTQLDLIGDAFHLSEDDCIYDPYMLPSQMLDRLNGEESVTSFLKQCEKCTHPHLRPDQEVLIKPGGQLVYAMSGHKGPLKSLDLMGSGKEAVTCCEDGDDEIRTWDVAAGKMIRCYDGLGHDPTFVSYAFHDQIIVVNFVGAVTGIKASGDIAFTIDTVSFGGYQICVGGEHKSVIALFCDDRVELYSAKDGSQTTTINNKAMNDLTYGLDGIVVGSENFFALTDTTQQHLSVFSMKSQSFLRTRQVMTSDADGEVLTVDALVIAPSEKQVFFADCWTNDIHICEIGTLKEIKVIKGSSDDYSINFHMTSDGRYLYFPSQKDIIFRDLSKNNKIHKLQHTCNVVDVKTADLKTIVTITEDTVVRVWDMNRPVKVGNMHKYTVGHNVWNIKTLANPRYVAAMYKKSDFEIMDFALIVYDLSEKKIVRQGNLDEAPGVFQIFDEKRVVVNMGSCKLKVVNLDTMETEKVFSGKVNKEEDTVFLSDSGLIVPTRGRHNLKVYNVTSGKTETILRGNETNKIEKLVCNPKNHIVMAKLEEEDILIFDIVKKSVKTVTPSLLGVDQLEDIMAVPTSGDHVVLTGTKEITLDGEVTEERVAFIWNAAKGKLVAELFDITYHVKYIKKENRRGLSVSVDETLCTEDSSVITADDDFIMRVWNLNTGKLQHRLSGHSSNIEMFHTSGSPHLFSYGCWEEENAVRVWDINTFKCIAAFKLDISIAKLCPSQDGQSFVTTCMNPSRIIHWKMHGVENMVDLSKQEKTFAGELTVDLELQDDADYDEEAEDPDTDVCESDLEENEEDDDFY